MYKPSEQDIEEAVGKIVAGVDPEKVILFGSHASGKPDKDSDVDLLIILETDLKTIDRYCMVSETLIPRPFPVDLLVYTRKEVDEQLTWTNSVVKEAVETGKVMHEKVDKAVAS